MTCAAILCKYIFTLIIGGMKRNCSCLKKTKKKVKAKLMYLINTQLLTEQAPKVNSVEVRSTCKLERDSFQGEKEG